MIHNRSIENSRRFFGLLLYLYPRDHRANYAVSMRQVFTDQCRYAYRDRGLPGLIWLWLRTLPDLGYTAVVEHLTSPRAAWGLMEPVPNAPLPWKGVLLVLLPGLVYLVSQIAQLNGQSWYLTVYYRGAFFLILPPLFVWIFTRRFPLWGLIPLGLLFRLVQEIGYQLVTLHSYVFSSNPLLNLVLTIAKTIQANPFIPAGFFTIGVLVLGWLYLRKGKPGRGFWTWITVYLLTAAAQMLMNLRWIMPATRETYATISPQDAITFLLNSLGWDAYNFSGFLLLVFLGILFTRKHGMFSILIVVGYLLPAMVVGLPWNLEDNPGQLILVSAAVLAYRGLLSLVAPVWMSRTPSQSGKKRIILAMTGLALAIHAVMQFYPMTFPSSGIQLNAEWVVSVLLEEGMWFSAVLLGLTLYQEDSPPAAAPDGIFAGEEQLQAEKA